MEIVVKIKRLSSSRSLRLRVMSDGTVVATAPLKLAQRQIDEFIDQHRDWITEKVGVAHSQLEHLTAERDRLFFRGQEYQFRLNVSSQKRPSVSIEDQTLIVTSESENHGNVRSTLEKWYRIQAKKHFEKRVPLLCDVADRDIMRVSIRSQRTRWGSCSSRQTISLNWRLIMAPDWVSDYVIYHEIAHLTHMNHSKKFWQLVEEYFPKYKEAELWLKKHHQLLQF